MSSNPAFWDDPEFIRSDSDYVKWQQPGQKEKGKLVELSMREFDDGKRAPQLTLVTDTGDKRIITASQVVLKSRLAASRPTEGDTITVTYLGENRLAGGRSLKQFDVDVERGDGGQVRQLFA